MLGEPRCALTWPGGGGSAENSSGKWSPGRSGPAGDPAQVSWGERRGVARRAGGGSRQSRGGHSMPGGEAQQISRELNPPGSQSAKNRFQAAVLKVWPRNHQDHRGSHSRESGRPNHFHDHPQDACAFFSSVLSQAYSVVSQ